MSKEVQLTLMGTWANVGSLLQAKQRQYASAFHFQVNREQDSNVARASNSVIIPRRQPFTSATLVGRLTCTLVWFLACFTSKQLLKVRLFIQRP